ncbi:MAG: M48 family metalloprotease [Proteobacteria bacterium]|nr:M48 family metalloprotease [SAR86 cluster bacterium]MDA0344746.1 M48 family metalloprotease [Pseudomonadota bacterium]MDA0900070.1 M48 family metalloprotease [Pseudomonadota bacterium]
MIKKTIASLSFLMCLCLAHAQDNSVELPLIGDRLSGAVSQTEEEILGRQFLRDLKRETKILYDPIVQEWTELFIYKIGESSKVNKKAFEVLIIEDNNLNAFAAPGGIIGVNAGLYKYSENEAQFASVIAHELAHLSQRHFARQVLENSDRSNANMATLLASIVVAVATRSPAAVIGGQGIIATQSLRYSRLYETEADREGFVTLERAGYRTQEMSEMFRNMQEIRRLSGDNVPEFLLTHPITTRRITESRERARKSDESGIIDTLNFKLIKQRVRFLMTDNLSIRALENEKYDSDDGMYFSALLERKKLNFSKSIEILEELEKKYPDNLIIKTTIAETYTESGNIGKSKSYTQNLLEISLGNYPLSYNLANAHMMEDNFLAAEQILEDIKFYRPVDINLLKDLSEVQLKSNNLLGYHLTNSEYLFYSGRYEEALRDLQRARSIATNNFKIREIITERILILQSYVRNSRNRSG